MALNAPDPFKELNRTLNSESYVRTIDPSDFDFFTSALELIENQFFTPDKLDGATVHDGVVYYVQQLPVLSRLLEVVTDVVDSVRENGITGITFDDGQKDVPSYVMKVWIPGLLPLSTKMPGIPDHRQFERGNSISEVYGSSAELVQILPTVFPVDANLDEPKPGDVIKVQFANLRELKGVVYVGKSKNERIMGGNFRSIKESCSQATRNQAYKPSFTNPNGSSKSSEDCLRDDFKAQLEDLRQNVSNSMSTKCLPRPIRSFTSPQTLNEFTTTDTEIKITSSIPYKENRVRTSSFGVLTSSSSSVVELPPQFSAGGRRIYVHRLLLPRLKALNNAWLREFGEQTIDSLRYSGRQGQIIQQRAASIQVGSGLRAVREQKFGSYEKYKQRLIKDYGSVREGRKYLAWDSPHGTGLAIDFSCNGLRPISGLESLQKQTTFWKWLRENAHTYGFTPYYAETWHWELLMPRENWKSAEEFASNDDFSVRVEEKGKKSGRLTSDRDFASQEFGN